MTVSFSTLFASLRRNASTVVVVSIGFALSIIIFYFAQERRYRADQLELERLANKHAINLKKGLSDQFHTLSSIVDFYAASREVERLEFKQFVHHSLESFPSIRAIAWAPRVLPSDVKQFEKAAQSDGQSDFHIHRLRPKPNFYVPIYYIEPARFNRELLGNDLYSNLEYRIVLEESRDQEKILAFNPEMITMENRQDNILRVIAPIYKNHLPHNTKAERQKNFLGYAIGFFSIPLMIDRALFNADTTRDVHFEIIDVTDPQKPLLIYPDPTADQEKYRLDKQVVKLHRPLTFEMQGRIWNLECHTAIKLIHKRDFWEPWGLLVIGLIITIILTYLQSNSLNRSEKIRHLIDKRTSELALANQELENEITERKRVQEDHSEKTRILESVLDNMSDGVVVVDENEKFLIFNPAAERMMGIGATNTTADQWSETYGIYLPDRVTLSPQENLPLSRTLRGEDVNDLELFIRNTYNPKGIMISVNARPLKDSLENNRGAIAVFRDITDRKQAEENRQKLETQFRQAQKMEAIGTLAGGIAHDFNNMLAGILGNTDIMKFYTNPGDEIRESTVAIEKAANRAASLTKQLLDFARRGKSETLPIDIHATISEVCNLLKRTFDKRIRIKQHLHANQFLVYGDPDRIQQVFLNLLINSRDSLPIVGGEIIIETFTEPLQNSDLSEGNPMLKISITDTGCGIPPHLQERIFEPFFTTKEHGKGTGMGLAMVYGIIKEHGGRISVQSEIDKGSRFDLFLPLSKSAALVSQFREPEAHSPICGSGKILIVDDEEIVRNTTSKLLTQLGYTVVTCADGLDAVEYYKQFHDHIDVIMMDVMMPNLSGSECFRLLKRINPKIRVILTSGYSLTQSVEEVLLEGVCDFIQKPYQVTRLAEAVAKAFNHSASG